MASGAKEALHVVESANDRAPASRGVIEPRPVTFPRGPPAIVALADALATAESGAKLARMGRDWPALALAECRARALAQRLEAAKAPAGRRRGRGARADRAVTLARCGEGRRAA